MTIDDLGQYVTNAVLALNRVLITDRLDMAHPRLEEFSTDESGVTISISYRIKDDSGPFWASTREYYAAIMDGASVKSIKLKDER